MDNLGRIRAHLKHRDSGFLAKTVVLLCIGFLGSLAAPALILIFFAFLLKQFKLELNWWMCFLAGIAISAPLLFRLEWQAHGPMLSEADREGFDTTPKKPAPANYKHLGALGLLVTEQRTPFNGLLEFFLIGPNLTVRSLRKLMLRKIAMSANFDRIVEITEILSRLKGGAEIEKLRGEKETPQELSCVLAYLIFFDWVGVARDGSKVWILTEARRELSRGAK